MPNTKPYQPLAKVTANLVMNKYKRKIEAGAITPKEIALLALEKWLEQPEAQEELYKVVYGDN